MSIAISSARTAELTGQTENPFFAWDNWAAGATYGGAATLADGAAANAFNGATYDAWRPNVTATTAALWVIFPTARAVKFAAFAAHNLGTLGASVQVQYSTDTGATWTGSGVGTVAIADDKPMAFRFAPGVSATHWRFNFSGLTAADPVYIGAAFMGAELVMPTRFYDGFAPIITPTDVQLTANTTEGGPFIRQSVKRIGSTLDCTFNHLEPSFVRGDFRPFQEAYNAGSPFFFGWRPATFPQDIHYGWRAGDALRPVNSGGLDFMSASISARVHEA